MKSRDGAARPPARPAFDGAQSGRWRSNARPSTPPAAKKPARLDPCAIAEEDLKTLPDIHALLRALNDAYAGGGKIVDLVGKLSVLGARCIRRARKRFPAKSSCTLAEALTLIGNAGLEGELLQMLEDLTVLSAELKPPPEPKIEKAPAAPTEAVGKKAG